MISRSGLPKSKYCPRCCPSRRSYFCMNSASVPSNRSDNRLRFGSLVSSPRPASGSPMTPWTTTSLPSSSSPAASQPRTRGNSSALRPTPRRLHTSCWFSAAAFTRTRAQPPVGNGFGTSPTLRPASGSAASNDVTLAASIKTDGTPFRGGHPPPSRSLRCAFVSGSLPTAPRWALNLLERCTQHDVHQAGRPPA